MTYEEVLKKYGISSGKQTSSVTPTSNQSQRENSYENILKKHGLSGQNSNQQQKVSVPAVATSHVPGSRLTAKELREMGVENPALMARYLREGKVSEDDILSSVAAGKKITANRQAKDPYLQYNTAEMRVEKIKEVGEFEGRVADYFGKITKLTENGGYINVPNDIIEEGKALLKESGTIKRYTITNARYMEGNEADIKQYAEDLVYDLRKTVESLGEMKTFFDNFENEDEYQKYIAPNTAEFDFDTRAKAALAYDEEDGAANVQKILNALTTSNSAKEQLYNLEKHLVYTPGGDIDWEKTAMSGAFIQTGPNQAPTVTTDPIVAKYIYNQLLQNAIDIDEDEQLLLYERAKEDHEYRVWLKRDFEYEMLSRNEDFIEKSNEGEKMLDGDVEGRRTNEMYGYEKATYFYLYATQGEEAADAYVKHLKNELKKRRGKETQKFIESRYFNGTAAFLYNLGTGFLDKARDSADFFTDLDKAVWDYTNEGLQESTKLTDTEKWFSRLGNTLGRQGASAAAKAINPYFGYAFEAASNYGAAEQEARDMGFTKSQQIKYGMLVSAGETALGAVADKALGAVGMKGSVDKRIDAMGSAWARIGLKLLSRVSSEEIEELTQEIFWSPAVRSYITGEEFELPDAEQVLETAAMTAISTLMLGAAGTTKTEIEKQNGYKATGKSLIESGKVQDLKDTTLSKMVDMNNSDFRVTNRLYKGISDSAEGLSKRGQAAKVGQLYTRLSQAEAVNNASADRIDISRQLQEKGYEPNKAEAIADALVAQNTGQELTRDQRKTLKQYKSDEVVNDIVEQIWSAGKGNVGQDTSVSDIGRSARDTLAKRAAGTPVGEGSPVPTEETGTAHPSDPASTATETAEAPTDSVPAADASGVAPSPMSVYESTLALGTNAPADPVAAATTAFTQNGTVTDKQVQDILNSTTAMDYLRQQTGIPIKGTPEERRNAVRQAIAKLAQQQAEVDSNTSVDTETDDTVADTASEKEHIGMEDLANSESRRLTEADLDEYMLVGDRQHVRDTKQRIKNSGESPILTSPTDIISFIRDAIRRKIKKTVKGYGRVNNRLTTAIKKATNGDLNITNYYLELDADKIAHMSDHVGVDKDVRNIPLTENQILRLPEYIDTYDDLIDVIRRKDGSVRIMLGKKINGHSIILETISKGRRSLHPVTAYQIDSEDYLKYYKTRAIDRSSTSRPVKTDTVDISRPAIALADITLADTEVKVNHESEISSATDTETSTDIESVGAAPSVPSDTGTAISPAKPNTKQATSAIYDNTYKNASGEGTRVVGEVAKAADPDIDKYDVVTEKESIGSAMRRTSDAEKVDTAYTELVNKTGWSGEDNDTAFFVLNHLRKNGDVNRLRTLAKRQREEGTRGAQLTQSFAKYTRMTATDCVLDVVEQVDSLKESDVPRRFYKGVGFEQWKTDVIKTANDIANQIDNIADGNVEGMKDIIRSLAKFRNTTAWLGYTSRLTKVAEVALKDIDFETAKAIANAQLSTLPNDFVKRPAGQIIKTIRIHNMLASLLTFGRNIGSNFGTGMLDATSDSTVGRGLDALMSLATGKRTVGNDVRYAKDYLRGATKATKLAALCVELDIPMDSESRFQEGATRTYSPKGNPVTRFMGAFEKLMRYSLDVSDQFFSGGTNAAVKKSLENLGEKSNLSEDEISGIASNVGKRRTFKEDRMLTKASKSVKTGLNKIGTGNIGVGDLMMPFVGTTSNVAQTAIDYSTLGIGGFADMFKIMRDVKNGKYKDGYKVTKNGETISLAEAQRQAVSTAGRGLTGAGLIAGFTALAANGIIAVHDDDDKDKRDLEQSSNLSGAQLNIDAAIRLFKGESTEWREGDWTVSVDFLEPANAQMYLGYQLSQDESVADMVKSYPGKAATSIFQAILDMPVMQGVSDLNDALTKTQSTIDDEEATFGDKAEEVGGVLLGNTASGFIPAWLRQIAQYNDPYYRDTTGDSAGERALNQVIAQIPGLSKTLPKKYDGLGRVQRRYEEGDEVSGFLNTFVAPGKVKKISTNEVTDYLDDLYERTGNVSFYPSSMAPGSFTLDGEKISINGKENTEKYQSTYGNKVNELYSELIGNDVFKSLSDSQQVEILNSAKKYAVQVAKASVSDYSEVPSYILNRPDGMTEADAIFANAIKNNFKSPFSNLTESWKNGKDNSTSLTDLDSAWKNYQSMTPEMQEAVLSEGGKVKDYITARQNGLSSQAFVATYKTDNALSSLSSGWKKGENSNQTTVDQLESSWDAIKGLSAEERQKVIDNAEGRTKEYFTARQKGFTAEEFVGSYRTEYTVTNSFSDLTSSWKEGKDNAEAVTNLDSAWEYYKELPAHVKSNLKSELSGRQLDYITARENGISAKVFTDLYGKYYNLNNDSGKTAKEKASEWSLELERARASGKITTAQRDILKNEMYFNQSFRAETERFDGFVEKGIPAETASYVDDLLNDLIPEKGKTAVSNIQKIETIAHADSYLTESQQQAAMEEILPEAYYAKYQEILKLGMDTDDYAKSYRIYLEEDDKGGKGVKARTIEEIQIALRIPYDEAKKLYEIYKPPAKKSS